MYALVICVLSKLKTMVEIFNFEKSYFKMLICVLNSRPPKLELESLFFGILHQNETIV